MQLVEYQSQPSFSHIEVPYDLELLGDCATSYHLIRPDDQYDDVVSLPHRFDVYQSYPVMDRSSLHEHIQVWEEFL